MTLPIFILKGAVIKKPVLDPPRGYLRQNPSRSAAGCVGLIPGASTSHWACADGVAKRAHAPWGGAGGGRAGRVWVPPVFRSLGAVGGAGGLTVVTAAPPPLLAGLWTVIAFGCGDTLATVPGNSSAGFLRYPHPPHAAVAAAMQGEDARYLKRWPLPKARSYLPCRALKILLEVLGLALRCHWAKLEA